VLPPQSAKDKFVTTTEDSFDYSALVLPAVLAGYSMATRATPEFRQGAAGYGRYFWHSWVDQSSENYAVEFIVPTLTHEDIRYYTLGRGGFFKRTGYAISRAVVTRSDSGTATFNLGEVVGAGAAAGVSNLYYPESERTLGNTAQKWGLNVGVDAGTFVFKEFWADINHALFHTDALRAQEALAKRLRRFSLTLEPTKTKLVEFGRYAHRHASKRGRKRPETIYFLGFTLYCTRNQKGNFRIGLLTEKSRLRRALMRLQDQMRQMRHSSLQEQVNYLNQMLRGHYAYYGIAGNIQALQRVHRATERYWRKMLSSRSWDGVIRWEQFQRIKERFPLLRPKLYLPYRELQAIAIL
jgi:hypothetical protein